MRVLPGFCSLKLAAVVILGVLIACSTCAADTLPTCPTVNVWGTGSCSSGAFTYSYTASGDRAYFGFTDSGIMLQSGSISTGEKFFFGKSSSLDYTVSVSQGAIYGITITFGGAYAVPDAYGSFSISGITNFTYSNQFAGAGSFSATNYFTPVTSLDGSIDFFASAGGHSPGYCDPNPNHPPSPYCNQGYVSWGAVTWDFITVPPNAVPVPEPSMIMLLTTGIGFVLYRRNNRG